MPTTILHNETYEQALHRRFQDEAAEILDWTNVKVQYHSPDHPLVIENAALHAIDYVGNKSIYGESDILDMIAELLCLSYRLYLNGLRVIRCDHSVEVRYGDDTLAALITVSK